MYYYDSVVDLHLLLGLKEDKVFMYSGVSHGIKP